MPRSNTRVRVSDNSSDPELSKSKPSLVTLPVLVLDLIAFQVANDDKYPNVVDFSSLSKLCLVCRKLLPSARRALYYSPFAFAKDDMLPMSFNIRQATGLRLLYALNFHGGLVRTTSGMPKWFEDFIFEEGPMEGAQGRTETEEWYLGVLGLCPLLQHVDYNVATQSIIRAVARAIKPSLPTITSVLVFNETNSEGSKATFATVFKLLATIFKQPLREVILNCFNMKKGPRTTGLCFPLAVDRLSISMERHTFCDAAYLPSPAASHPLRHLSYSFGPPPESSKLSTLADRVGSQLESLEIGAAASLDPIRLSSYGLEHDGMSLPLDSFPLFPQLKLLILHNCRGPSLVFLEMHLSKSPLLEELSFEDSCWISDSDRKSTDPDEIFPDREILDCFYKFKHLRKVHLGTLPTTDRSTCQLIQDGSEEMGVVVKFDICE
ncbi:uncharacterized protein JCM6883_001193 [Sporobolomyces salmoneus]|uniref:uncharacterized protein n=1 Tax=Sporobolomyces salmoneus TaxID=183962 RepID=UPI0031755059